MKWYLPQKVILLSNPPSPLEFPGPLTPPLPWNFQFPPWWRSGYFLEPHIISFNGHSQSEDREQGMRQHQCASSDPERSLA